MINALSMLSCRVKRTNGLTSLSQASTFSRGLTQLGRSKLKLRIA